MVVMRLGEAKHNLGDSTSKNLPIIVKLSAQRLFDSCSTPEWNPRDRFYPSWFYVEYSTENPPMEGVVSLWVHHEPKKDRILIGDNSQTRAVAIVTPWSVLWEESKKNFDHPLSMLVSVYLYAKFIVHVEEPFTYCCDFSADPKTSL